MPDLTIKDGQSGDTFTMPWEGKDPPSESDIAYYKYQKDNPPEQGLLGKIGDVASKVKNSQFVKGAAETLLPSTTPGDYLTGPAYALRHPIDSAKLLGGSLINTQKEQFQKASDPNVSPTLSEKIGHIAAGSLPILGPAAANAGENIGSGNTGKGLGQAAGLLAPFAAHGAAGLLRDKPDINPIQPQAPISTPRPVLGLPPAPEHIANPPRFLSGPAGVAETGKTYPMDTGPNPDVLSGTVPASQFGSVTQLPASMAAEHGTTLGRIPKLEPTPESIASTEKSLVAGNPVVLPKSGPDTGNVGISDLPNQLPPAAPKPSISDMPTRVPNQALGTIADITSEKQNQPSGKVNLPPSQPPQNMPPPITQPMGNVGNVPGNVMASPEVDPAQQFKDQQFNKYVNKPSSLIPPSPEVFPMQKAIDTMQSGPLKDAASKSNLLKDESGFIGRKPQASTIPTPEVPQDKPTTPIDYNSSYASKNIANRPIPVTATPEEAIKQWADGLAGAQTRGKFASESFKDLTDPALIDKYESGDRTGRLADVQKYHDLRQKQGVDVGLLKEGQSIPNYLRHEYEQFPEDVSATMKDYIAKNPSIAKTRKIATYADARAAGLTPKLNTIPEAVQAYESKLSRAMHNKNLYDYLTKTDQLKAGELVKSPDNWTFKGPNADELKKYLKNAMSQSEGKLSAVADASSLSKNLQLAGGIPYTKYNMHMYNIAKNDFALNGVSAVGKLLSDPTGNKAVEWAANLPGSEKHILADLTDRGWQGKPMTDIGESVNLPEKLSEKVKSPLGKKTLGLAGKIVDASQKTFEKPLFEKALPALNAQRTLEAFHKLHDSGMDVESSLQGAAKIGNEFYGGVDKVLRSSTNRDLGRIAFLAPDWLESQVRKAYSQWKGAAKAVTGNGTPVDKMYAKSLVRSAALPAIGTVGTVMAGKKLMADKERDISALPIGSIDNVARRGSQKQREIPTLTTANEEWRLPVAAPIEMMKGNPAAIKDILVKNRISTGASTVWDLVNGQDQYGNALSGQDKFGRKIPFGKAMMNYGEEASRPVQHQVVQALVSWLKGDISAEEATAKGLELPIAYSTPPKSKPTSHTAPRFRLRP